MRKNARKRLHREVAAYLAAVNLFRQLGNVPTWQSEADAIETAATVFPVVKALANRDTGDECDSV